MIDIAAQKLFTDEKEGREIAVKVKSFLSFAKINELYGAIGQDDVYRLFIVGLTQRGPKPKRERRWKNCGG